MLLALWNIHMKDYNNAVDILTSFNFT